MSHALHSHEARRQRELAHAEDVDAQLAAERGDSIGALHHTLNAQDHRAEAHHHETQAMLARLTEGLSQPEKV